MNKWEWGYYVLCDIVLAILTIYFFYIIMMIILGV